MFGAVHEARHVSSSKARHFIEKGFRTLLTPATIEAEKKQIQTFDVFK